MAKQQNDRAPAEDYIDQLQWRSRHGWRSSIRFEPKWKYKIVYRLPRTTPVERIFNMLFLGGILFFVIYLFLSDTLIVCAKIFLGCMLGLIFIILFFAVKDATDDRKDDDLE